MFIVNKENDAGWSNVYGFSMKAIRDLAIKEPLVDVVEQQAVISDSSQLIVSLLFFFPSSVHPPRTLRVGALCRNWT